ncbi:helix-turn-helix domain-containing protein [Kitasatospora griseola]|uniref:helix-turn-helix domain-containing protein n=1 Tax=Kitasatospora griseola TaxID=2064 RepID=UPI00366862AE
MFDTVDDHIDAELPDPRALRIRNDTARVEELRRKEFKGPGYDQLLNDLCGEAMRLLRGMLRTGSLVRYAKERFAEKGITFFVHEDDIRQLRSSPADRDEIIIDTLMEALKGFRQKVLVEGGWDPNYAGPRGASCLLSFFIGRCIWAFRRPYIRWVKARMRLAELEAGRYDGAVLERLLEKSRFELDSRSFVKTSFTEAFSAIVSEQQPGTRAVVALTLEGYRTTEIADMLGMNRSTVSMRMHRFQNSVYEAAREKRIWIPEQLHASLHTSKTPGAAA